MVDGITPSVERAIVIDMETAARIIYPHNGYLEGLYHYTRYAHLLRWLASTAAGARISKPNEMYTPNSKTRLG